MPSYRVVPLILLILCACLVYWPTPLGNSYDVGVGDTVITIGNPFGLSDTMTTGVVSGIDRSVPYGGYLILNAIQTDAPINPGNYQ